MTNTIYDITHESDAIMLVGSNPEHAHPVLGMQVRQAVERGAKLIVVDPRDIDLTKRADVHLKLRPGTNVAFANGASRNFEYDLGGGWFEIGVGANISLSKATYIYADIEKTFGGEVDTNWQWNLGVRYSF